MKNLDPGGLTYNPWAFGDGLAPGIRYIGPGYLCHRVTMSPVFYTEVTVSIDINVHKLLWHLLAN